MLAALLGLVIGIVIGGLGGGGGVLAVPVLVYLLGQTPQDATSGSLVIVGVTAVAGALARVRAGLVRWRTGLAFGVLGIPAAALGTLLNQRVPAPVLLLSFAALTVLAALAMIVDSGRPGRVPESTGPTGPAGRPPARERPGAGTATPQALPGSGVRTAPESPAGPLAGTAVKIVLGGLAVGFLTGFLGVGGGFLMIPVLVIALRMPMTLAVGTSLLIIASNSAVALATRAGVAQFDWPVLVPFTVAAVVASFGGKLVADRLSGPTLGRVFAILLLVVGVGVAIESFVAL